MKIVMIGQKGIPARSGGIERHVELLASGLASRGHEVVVYGRRWYSGDREIDVDGVKSELSSGIRTKHLDAITHSLTALFRAHKHRPDIIHIHGAGVALLSPVARLLFPRAKIITTIHCLDRVLSKWNGFARHMFGIGEAFACIFSHQTVTVSEELSRYCLETYKRQTRYIPHAFPLPKDVDTESVRELGLEADGYFLFVGRLIPDKNAHLLVEAYAKARQARADLFVARPLVIVGSSSSTNDYVEWLYRKVAGMRGVLMVGEKHGEELRSLQKHAFAHVFPTSNEGLSLAVLEAAAYARPIIATSISANIEATGNHMLACSPGSIDSLAETMIAICETDHAELQELGDAARIHVERVFHREDRIDDVIRLYQEAIHGRLDLVTEVCQ